MGQLILHDLHEQNLEAMQRVVDLGRQLGRPIFTSLWSSRADRPSVGSGKASFCILYLVCAGRAVFVRDKRMRYYAVMRSRCW